MERLIKPSLAELEEMKDTPQNSCNRVCGCSWNMGGRVSTQACTDVTTIEELTICCRRVESDVPEEHFIDFILEES